MQDMRQYSKIITEVAISDFGEFSFKLQDIAIIGFKIGPSAFLSNVLTRISKQSKTSFLKNFTWIVDSKIESIYKITQQY